MFGWITMLVQVGYFFFMGNVQFEVVACTLNSLSKVETPIRDNIRELVI